MARNRTRKIREILLATASELNERGYHATNMEDVAARMGLTKATLYHYFTSKDVLVAECLSFVGNEVNERLATLATRTAGQSPTERLRALLREQLTILVRDYPEAGRLFTQPLDWPAGHQNLVRRLRDRHDQFLREIIQDGIASGNFRNADATIVGHCIQGAVEHAPEWIRGDPGAEHATVAEQVIDHLLKLVH